MVERSAGARVRMALLVAVMGVCGLVVAVTVIVLYGAMDEWTRGFAVGLVLAKPLRDGWEWMVRRFGGTRGAV